MNQNNNMKCLAVVVLSVWAGLAGVLTARAQSITPISFFNYTNGTTPQADLTLGPDGTFYGTTYGGGSGGYGTVFQVTTNGTLTTLVNFNYANGANPQADLTLGPDGYFYGTTTRGGSSGDGTVFQLTTNGILTTLVNFNLVNGAFPERGLTLGPDGNFYGTTGNGGSSGEYGTVFKVTTNGTLTTLVNFDYVNGSGPLGNLTLGLDGNFYGTTYEGGSGGDGTVFKVTTNGTLTTLVNFDSSNGAFPYAGLTLGPDGNFYGTTSAGGIMDGYGVGTVFQVMSNGTFRMLVNFNNTGAAYPTAKLMLGPDGSFYGTTENGGSGVGTVFQVTTNGMMTILANFNNANGAEPLAGLTLGPDGNFYGTAGYSGSGGNGTIFQLNLPPEFIMAPADQTTVIGGTATFNCQVFGTRPFAYQWQSNGVPIDGATNATLTISPVLTSATGNYQLVVSNTYGSVTSQVASLNVLLQPNIYAISNSGGGNYTVSLASLPDSTNRLWATTDMALPSAQWQVIATNVMDGNGLSQFLDTNTAGMPQKFYRLSYP